MVIFLTIVHVFVCLVLIIIVLMQHGKGADIGVSFGGGGGSNTVFGARGAGNFLTKLTTGSAIVFMLTSFALSRYAVSSSVDDVLGEPIPASEAPATPEGPSPAPLEAPAPAEPPSSFEEIPETPPPTETPEPAKPPS